MSIEGKRGSGRTTKQMQEAVHNAVFIVPMNRDYFVQLASRIGRDDLEIVTATWLETGRWQGREFSQIILDHDCKLSMKRKQIFNAAQSRVRRKA